MHLFYTPDIAGNRYTLDETESKHCIKVLRLVNGDMITLMDGKGTLYDAVITDAHPKKCTVEVTNKTVQQRNPFSVHIAIAPTKSIDRFEWFLEKATEIGIDEITPLLCEHSERRNIKNERLQRVIIAAMKQSLKAHKPVLNELVPLRKFVSASPNGNKFIAHCQEGDKPHLKGEIKKAQPVIILIGPEGDFSPEEVNFAKQNGFTEIVLGKSRLRTETAGIVACHIVNLENETTA